MDVELQPAQPPELLYHGTGAKSVASIDEKGLLPRSRLYVHLSALHDTAIAVGTRHGSPVIYRVRSGDMYAAGHKFYLSVNGVWLTKHVPVEYLEKE